jgi:hypothetical protein
MPSISLRKERIPKNLVVIHKDTSVPVGYDPECTLYDKFLRGTPTAGTCPGGTEGADTHTHCAAGSHNHTTSSTTHSHTRTSGTFVNGNIAANQGGSSCQYDSGHTHLVTSTCVSPTLTVCNAGSHTHDTINNDPVNKTQFFLKHNETSLNLRRRALGHNSIFMWARSLSSLPSRFSKDSNFDCNYIKGVPNGCGTPNTAGGANTHQHDAHTNHAHNVSLPAHCHTVGTVGNSGGFADDYFFAPSVQVANFIHTHNAGTASFTNNTVLNTCSPTASTSAHNSLNHEPENKTTYFISQPSISLRYHGLVPGGMAIWVDNICPLPTCYQVADGTNCTIDFRNKYVKGEGGCSPATTGGSNTHTHASGGGCHTHGATSIAHTHPMTGQIQNGATTGQVGNECPANHAGASHDHNVTGNSSSSGGSPSLNGTTDAHTHGSKNNQPETVLVSYLERLIP